MSRRKRWTIDTLERRDLLSITPLINSPGWVQTQATTTPTQAAASSLTVDPTTGIVSNPGLGGSGTTNDLSPARAGEVAARKFVANFSGRLQELPPACSTSPASSTPLPPVKAPPSCTARSRSATTRPIP